MHTFLSSLSETQRSQLVTSITAALETTFAQDGARQTQSEIKRRFDLCADLAGRMRTDLHWSLQRIHDTLPLALRCELDGANWEPDERQSWITDERSGLILPTGLN